MKKELLKVCVGLMSIYLFAFCQKSTDPNYVSYGVIQNRQSSDKYEILTDKGNTLVVTKSHTSQETVDGKRVLANFNLLSDKDKSRNIYEVEVNGFYYLLSKPPVSESFIFQDEERRRDSIGNDPINALHAWVSGGYLNINFEAFYAQYSNIKHFINLVYDDTRADADTVYLTLRHNAYDEKPDKMYDLYRGAGRCSFKVIDLQPLGGPSKPYKLTWLQYTHGYESQEHSAVYTSGNQTATAAGFEEQTLNPLYDNQIEMK